MKKRVVIKDGRSANLYKVEKSGGKFLAYHVKVDGFVEKTTKVGSSSTFEGAVQAIKGHAGTDRIEINNW
jgi:hypothetical protein